MKLTCPHCQCKLKNFIIDFDPLGIRCEQCDGQIPPEHVFTKSTVNDLLFLIPEEKRETFLSQIGFERRPVRRTSKLVLILFIGLMVTPMLGVGVWSAIVGEKLIRMVYSILGSILVILMILGYYRREAKPKYRKKEA